MSDKRLDDATGYIFARVLDTLLREDVQQLTSRGRRVAAASVGVEEAQDGGDWWHLEHLTAGELWIPVTASTFMQRWCYRPGPVIGRPAGGSDYRVLADCDALLQWLSSGLEASELAHYRHFATECREAAAQRLSCQGAQQAYFRDCRDQAGEPETWAERFLHYDRLASYLDHPYYPTARAKSGFGVADLQRYAPEFQPRFQLRWLAVPRALYRAAQAAEPAWKPAFGQVGLCESLAADYRLVPVHPFLWDQGLTELLQGAGLDQQVIRAPGACLEVVPTLSVRSLMLVAQPDTHIKLPLTIRTLGSRNIRTVKPSTIGDGQRVQDLLGAIARQDDQLRQRLLLTDERQGAHVDGHSFLGYIQRLYPAEVSGGTLVSVAGLLAVTPAGCRVFEELSARFYQGDVLAFLRCYLELTFAVHVTLWLRYGIALESNQQNSMLLLDPAGGGMRLLLKDNDAPRIERAFLAARWPDLYRHVEGLQDQRIWSQDPLALGQMFTTITLQLNVAPLIEGLAELGHGDRRALYGLVVQALEDSLAALPTEDAGELRRLLLEDDDLYAKYLLTAGTLQSKTHSGAADINKFYGKSAPNFLREAV
jgi:siderophore synthetase component